MSTQPSSAATVHGQVTDAQMARYCELIYRTTGIRIPAQKKTLVSNRVRRRLKQHQLADFEAYYKLLSRLPADDPEWDAFLQEITTHETYLFRDEVQWDWFQNEYLRRLAAEVRAGKRQPALRVWSAACSTGDEPYTIACCLAGCLENPADWRIQILGTDIGIGALKQAKAGIFGERSMRLVPERFRGALFSKSATANIWQAKPLLSQWITFKQHNLLSPLHERPFDLVLVKNVLIYFDGESKKQVLEHVRKQILPGGLLVAGAAEGVAELVKDFERLQPWLYRRREAAR